MNNKMPEIYILVGKCGGYNKNNLMIQFMNIIKEGRFFGTDTLNLYTRLHTKNGCDH